MTTPKSVKLASVISLAAVALFALATLLINICQDSVVTLYAGTASVAEDSSYIFPAQTIGYIAGAVLIAVSDYLMIKEKAVLAPLVLSGLAAIFTLPASAVFQNVQSVFVARFQGADALARIGYVSYITDCTFYILNAAVVCTVAASAAYAYAKKKGYADEQ